MPNTLSVTPPKIYEQMNRNDRREEKLVLTIAGNEGLAGYHGRVISRDTAGDWIRLKPCCLALDPVGSGYGFITLELTVPTDAGFGEHGFTVQFVNDDEVSSEATDVAVVIDVQNTLKTWLQQNIWLIIALGAVAIVIAFFGARLIE